MPRLGVLAKKVSLSLETYRQGTGLGQITWRIVLPTQIQNNDLLGKNILQKSRNSWNVNGRGLDAQGH